MYTAKEVWKEKLRNLAWKLFSKLENNDNVNFDENGESFFIESLLKTLSQTEDNSKKIIIFDIGANIGHYTTILQSISLLNQLSLEIHLFEPTQSCFNILTEKFGHDTNIILNNFGASSEDGETVIFYDKEQSGLASLYDRNLDAYNLKFSHVESVSVKKISNYIKERGILHIDFIKIDIEGHELKAFEGFCDYINADFIDYIQFEYGGANLDSHTSLMELYTFFQKRNFSIAKIMPNGLSIRIYQPWMDNFTYANYVAISNKVLKK
ncbi:FkbM family methyltransferase [Acinetobacter sp. VNH17]|uniref:FkbM family methyltransferase n=1 Tax=Acinetobacter thutiue TaxID=2998078 RepID=A0ABT7WPC4_9GAMM|nr:FkbM family methyltransferase [Acinetobacter thutiue]MCY6412415.1 FkbM family methyltransferase [Acinetobacter thutiue]MDN0014520.1 FkbM family methyltransferase [Acinetobacter thutiue]